MRKLVFLSIVVASVLADFGAFGATARGSRSAATKTNVDENNAGTITAPVSARAAVRGAKAIPTTQSISQGAPVSARAAVRNASKTTTNVTSDVKTSATGAVAARAGAKQKVVNMGTKVAAATANTVVSQECQDAYFGCMDSFCMLENVTGGRCKCSDKNAEYDNILAEIMNLDQQSYVMQTEGVSLLKMGKSADEVYAMAENAASKVSKDKKVEETSKKKLDISAWDKSLFEDDEEFFEDETSVLDTDLTSKTGDKLHAIAASTCTQEAPAQCKSSIPMLRMIYVQKIQSDCAAYENSLKQQQMESEQKLQTARQSLRETALEKYQEANKYDLGGCVNAFNACMQQEDVCGNGFLGCVSFAAMDNLKNDTAGTVAKQTTIKGKFSSITLAATTMDELLSKRVLCDNVLNQCVKANENDAVWTAFLKSAAPAIKTAESDAENNLRMNCVKEVSECFQTGCKEQMDANNPDGSYDMCLSNPDLYKSLCKPKLEPCLLATGGTYESPKSSSLWTALLARLSSMKVDACTKEVRDCLLSEDRCGKDYAGCIGLSTYQIGQLCPVEKLTACRDDRKDMKEEERKSNIREYVAKVAQGIALNIDNSMLAHCQTALKTAMLTYCGAEDTCPNAAVDENIFKGMMHVELCNTDDYTQCSSDPYFFDKKDLINGKIVPTLKNKVDVAALIYDVANFSQSDNKKSNKVMILKTKNTVFSESDGASGDDKTFSGANLDKLKKTLETAFANMVRTVESDPKVSYCMTGRAVQGFDETGWLSGVSEENKKGRFAHLTDTIRNAIAQSLLDSVYPVYFATQDQVLSDEYAAASQNLTNRINEIVAMNMEKQHNYNQKACNALRYIYGNDPEPGFSIGCVYGRKSTTWGAYTDYDKATAVCTVTKRVWNCVHKESGCCWKWDTGIENSSIEDEKHVHLPTISRTSMRDSGEDGGLIENPLKDIGYGRLESKL